MCSLSVDLIFLFFLNSENPFLHTETTEKLQRLVNIRIGGRLFQTRESTLDAYPFTMLGDHRERMKYYDPGEMLGLIYTVALRRIEFNSDN